MWQMILPLLRWINIASRNRVAQSITIAFNLDGAKYNVKHDYRITDRRNNKYCVFPNPALNYIFYHISHKWIFLLAGNLFFHLWCCGLSLLFPFQRNSNLHVNEKLYSAKLSLSMIEKDAIIENGFKYKSVSQ